MTVSKTKMHIDEALRIIEDVKTCRQVISEKWKNVYFSKSGKSYRGDGLFDSENEAQSTAAMGVAHCLADPGALGFEFEHDGYLPKEEYSHFIPVPWLKRG